MPVYHSISSHVRRFFIVIFFLSGFFFLVLLCCFGFTLLLCWEIELMGKLYSFLENLIVFEFQIATEGICGSCHVLCNLFMGLNLWRIVAVFRSTGPYYHRISRKKSENSYTRLPNILLIIRVKKLLLPCSIKQLLN